MAVKKSRRKKQKSGQKPQLSLQQAVVKGAEHHRAGRLDKAEELYRKVLRKSPDNPDALNLLGVILNKRGHHEKAVELISKAVAVKPDLTSGYNNLGNALLEARRLQEAAKCYQKAISLRPDFADAYFNLGRALKELGRLTESAAVFRKGLELRPDFAPAYNNYGLIMKQLGQTVEAVRCYKRALELDPEHMDAKCNLAEAFRKNLQLEESLKLYVEALEINPESSEVVSNVGGVYGGLGDAKNAIEHYKRAVDLAPQFAGAHSNLLFSLHYLPDISMDDLFAAHREWNARHAAPIEALPPAVPSAPDKQPLTVGLVSKCFRRHPTLALSLAGLEALDSDRIRLIAYPHMEPAEEDDMTERLKAVCHDWRSIAHLDDAEAARQIRADGVDILVDMTGHSESRLLICAYRPAPVQVKWVGGQFNTTGMVSIDWVIADEMEIPEDQEKWYTEGVWRLPDGYIVYDPPADAPEVGPLPAREAGHVTFGCFNNPLKVNEEIVRVWADVLKAVPDSRLFLKGKAYGFDEPAGRICNMFAEHGIAADRLVLEGNSAHRDLLDCYNRVDIALDPWPYSGGLTTCEALWMGVPVLTLPGPTFAGRHAASHINNAGLSDWIVADWDAYIEKAACWAENLDELEKLRASLRDKVAASPLCDGPRFARNLENAFQEMWHEACGQTKRAKAG